jgi:general stress protein YciG
MYYHIQNICLDILIYFIAFYNPWQKIKKITMMKKGKMTVEEAGRKGGEAVINKYGPEHMAEIGRKGGEHSHGGHGGSESNRENEENNNKSNSNSKRGLASADKETRERVARKGGES